MYIGVSQDISHEGLKRVECPLEMVLQMVVSYYAGTENQT